MSSVNHIDSKADTTAAVVVVPAVAVAAPVVPVTLASGETPAPAAVPDSKTKEPVSVTGTDSGSEDDDDDDGDNEDPESAIKRRQDALVALAKEAEAKAASSSSAARPLVLLTDEQLDNSPVALMSDANVERLLDECCRAAEAQLTNRNVATTESTRSFEAFRQAIVLAVYRRHFAAIKRYEEMMSVPGNVQLYPNHPPTLRLSTVTEIAQMLFRQEVAEDGTVEGFCGIVGHRDYSETSCVVCEALRAFCSARAADPLSSVPSARFRLLTEDLAGAYEAASKHPRLKQFEQRKLAETLAQDAARQAELAKTRAARATKKAIEAEKKAKLAKEAEDESKLPPLPDEVRMHIQFKDRVCCPVHGALTFALTQEFECVRCAGAGLPREFICHPGGGHDRETMDGPCTECDKRLCKIVANKSNGQETAADAFVRLKALRQKTTDVEAVIQLTWAKKDEIAAAQLKLADITKKCASHDESQKKLLAVQELKLERLRELRDRRQEELEAANANVLTQHAKIDKTKKAMLKIGSVADEQKSKILDLESELANLSASHEKRATMLASNKTRYQQFLAGAPLQVPMPLASASGSDLPVPSPAKKLKSDSGAAVPVVSEALQRLEADYKDISPPFYNTTVWEEPGRNSLYFGPAAVLVKTMYDHPSWAASSLQITKDVLNSFCIPEEDRAIGQTRQLVDDIHRNENDTGLSLASVFYEAAISDGLRRAIGRSNGKIKLIGSSATALVPTVHSSLKRSRSRSPMPDSAQAIINAKGIPPFLKAVAEISKEVQRETMDELARAGAMSTAAASVSPSPSSPMSDSATATTDAIAPAVSVIAP